MQFSQETPTEEDVHDAADIMAQTMGFSSFGATSRPSKRRRMDDAVVASPQDIAHGSAANSIPLGIRQSQPAGTAVAHHHPPAHAQTSINASNVDEIDLDLGEEVEDEVDDGVAGNVASSAPAEGAAASSAASNRGASGSATADRPHEPPGRGQGQPWYADYYDRKSNQNPWKKLEEKLGLEPRDSWPPQPINGVSSTS